MNELFNDILVERQRQIHMYGEQHHDFHGWMRILKREMEELEEGHELGEGMRPLYPEVVQIAAVALAWMEHLQR